jgi:hypothetical protein
VLGMLFLFLIMREVAHGPEPAAPKHLPSFKREIEHELATAGR